MTIVRCAAGAAAVVTAMLVQATVVGPLVYPVPVSLPLLVVVGVALLSGPSTGIALGFGAGLLADLTSQHPVGVLALAWLGAGVLAGLVGGVVVAPVRAGSPATRRRSGRRSGPGRSRRARGLRTDRSATPPREESRWRAQAMLTGLLAALATGAGLVLLATVDATTGPLPSTLILLVPTLLVDAMLAVPVLLVARPMLASAALRPVVPARLGARTPPSGRPMELV